MMDIDGANPHLLIETGGSEAWNREKISVIGGK
jgi:hypothetical protein